MQAVVALTIWVNSAFKISLGDRVSGPDIVEGSRETGQNRGLGCYIFSLGGATPQLWGNSHGDSLRRPLA